jgi:hypothetical protein
MSGYGTHVVDAEPNFAAGFTPHPEYWISFGSFVPGPVPALHLPNDRDPRQRQ